MHGLFHAASAAAAAGTQAYHASVDASRAAEEVSAAREEVALLKADIEKLLMISEALWTLLKENHGHTDEELTRRIEAIDLRDGKLDGKVAKGPPRRCPTCNRTLLGRRPVCLYCGQRIALGAFER